MAGRERNVVIGENESGRMTTRGWSACPAKVAAAWARSGTPIEPAMDRCNEIPHKVEMTDGPENPETPDVPVTPNQIDGPPDAALILLERLAQALRIDLVVLDGQRRPRLVVNHGSTLFRSNDNLVRLARRLEPHIDTTQVAIAHADPQVVDGAEVCAFRALDRMVMVASGPAHPRAPSVRGLMMLYKLTPAEARVANLLALELSPGEIAEAVGVELSTVRTQLKAIRSKLFAESQTDLVRRLLQSAAVFEPG